MYCQNHVNSGLNRYTFLISSFDCYRAYSSNCHIVTRVITQQAVCSVVNLICDTCNVESNVRLSMVDNVNSLTYVLSWMLV